VLTTEDPRFALDPHPVDVSVRGRGRQIRFHRPGAIILRTRTATS
jgi:hypothetical protein